MQPLAEDQVRPAAASMGMLVSLAGALGVGLAILGLLFWPECVAAVGTWNASTAYGHCYLVLPMALYLIWERRAALAGVPVRPALGFAALGLPLAVGWLAMERLGIMEGRQLAAMGAVELLLLADLGWRMFLALLGPLLFLVFMVPFGAFITPALQAFTAAFTVGGLNLLGIPNYSDAFTIEIPEGTFFVAEACAGLRFLIAAIAFGVFYALLNYRSPVRRAAFITASIVVPIVANGFRALGIVVLGRLLGSAEAAAADHVIYGWVFFSVVMLLLIAAGMPLRELPAEARASRGHASPRGPVPAVAAALAVCLLVGAGPAVARLLDARATPALMAAAPALELPDGCVRTGPAPTLPATRIAQTFDCGGQSWTLLVETFPARSTGNALIAERRRLTGELTAEDAQFLPLTPADAANGAWTLVQTSDPFGTTAFATWIDGAPAQGGLAGRLVQARDSVWGGDHAPVLIAISSRSAGRPSLERQRAQMQTVQRWVDRQTGLTAQVEALSRGR